MGKGIRKKLKPAEPARKRMKRRKAFSKDDSFQLHVRSCYDVLAFLPM